MRMKLALGATVAAVFLASAPASTASAGPVAYAPAKASADSRQGAATPLSRVKRKAVGIHGTATLRTKNAFVDYTWQRGSIVAKDASTLTVRSRDGVTWTWKTTSDTRFRRAGAKADLGTLVVGDRVFAIGVAGKPNPTAALVRVPKKLKNPESKVLGS
ncbi:hypothetical protein [Acrocarpospora phusangensis]|nr:hypothetical protein [Acrocarpospora phusangensis]